ncbi:MFS transporter [Photobacterium ganghwense]|uniref:MFS transporter n=1 Tax=Photobacterium ganghwense TaxID=320778 RepID=UPI004055DE7D
MDTHLTPTSNTRYRLPLVAFFIHFLVALDGLMAVPLSAMMTAASHTQVSQAGYLTSSYTLAAAITCLLIRSRTSNRFIVMLCLIGLAASTVAVTVTSDFAFMLAARVAAGVFGGALTVLNVEHLLACIHPSQKKKFTAYIMSTYPLALTVGIPVLLLFAGKTDWQSAFWMVGGLLVIALLGFGLLPLSSFTSIANTANACPHQQLAAASQYHTVDEGMNRPLISGIAAIILAVFSTFLLSLQFPVMLLERLAISEAQLSLSYLLGGSGCFVAMQWYGHHHPKQSLRLITALSGGIVITALAGFSLQWSLLAVFCFAGFMVVSATRTLVLVTEIISSVSDGIRVRVIGMQNALQHFSAGSAGAISSMLILPAEAGSPGYTPLLVFATLCIGITPVMWRMTLRLSRA